MLDIVCFLARKEDGSSPGRGLNSLLSDMYPTLSQAVEHVNGSTSLCYALQLMHNGVRRLVVPATGWRRKKKGKLPGVHDDFCWVSQEDVLRYLLGCIGIFYPLPMMSLRELGVINTDVMTVDENAEAFTALSLMESASQEMSAVAVVSGGLKDEGARPKLLGDVSVHTMRNCNAMTAQALAALSMKDFLFFINDPTPPEFVLDKMRSSMKLKIVAKSSNSSGNCSAPGFTTLGKSVSIDIESDDIASETSSTDEEVSESSSSDEEPVRSSGPSVEVRSNRSIYGRGGTLVTCRPESSLVAVMAQALAHRVNHVWVTDDDGGLVGIVTYADIIRVLFA